MSGSDVGDKQKMAKAQWTERKRRERARSEAMKLNLKLILEKFTQHRTPAMEEGPSSQETSKSKRGRKRKTLDIETILMDCINVVSTLRAAEMRGEVHTPSAVQGGAQQEAPLFNIRQGVIRSETMPTMLVRIKDLVVLESNRAMHLFQPFEKMGGYEGQSLWYQTHWKDHDEMEEFQKKLMSRGHVAGELSLRVRLRRIMDDSNSGNNVCIYRLQHISVVHVSADQSTMLCIFLPSKQDLAPIATDEGFFDQFERPRQPSRNIVSSTAYDYIEDFEANTPHSLPQRILKAMGLYHSLHSWLTSVAVLNIKTVTSFSVGDQVDGKRGVVSMSVFLVGEEHNMDQILTKQAMEPFVGINFAKENRLYVGLRADSIGGDTHVLHVLRIGGDDANEKGEIFFDGMICSAMPGDKSGKAFNGGGLEFNLAENGRHYFTLISPMGQGHRPTLSRLLAYPVRRLLPDELDLVWGHGEKMSKMCLENQFMAFCHGNIDLDKTT